MLKREWCIAKIDVHLECVLSASACLYVSERACECVPMCVRNCLCVAEYFVHVCTQTINMIKKKTAERRKYNTRNWHANTHSSMRLTMMMTKSAWMAKMTTSTNCFFPVAFWTCFAAVARYLFVRDYFDTYTYHSFFSAAIFSSRFVYGFTFLKFWFYFPRHHLLNSDPLGFLRIYLLHIKNWFTKSINKPYKQHPYVRVPVVCIIIG